MISRVLAKKNTQAMIKALRNAGLTVTKSGGKYECKVGDKLLFVALNGANGYLVRYEENLFL